MVDDGRGSGVGSVHHWGSSGIGGVDNGSSGVGGVHHWSSSGIADHRSGLHHRGHDVLHHMRVAVHHRLLWWDTEVGMLLTTEPTLAKTFSWTMVVAAGAE